MQSRHTRRLPVTTSTPRAPATPGNRRRSALSLAAGLALATLAPGVQAAPAVARWTLTDLGTLGGDVSAATGLNADGQVTGYAFPTGDPIQNGQVVQRAFRYSNGTMVDLGTLGGTSSYGSGINAAGQVTGYAWTTGDESQLAFIYSNGTMNALGTLGGSTSYGYGINAGGQVTGVASTAGDAATHAFLYSNGRMTDLGTLGGNFSIGQAINDAGQVTGYANTAGNAFDFHAFVYANGKMTDLGTLGGTTSFGNGINAAGQVTGSADIMGNAASHAFLYSQGTMVDIGTMGMKNSFGAGINTAGQIVGAASSSGPDDSRAFLYSGGTMADLNTFNGVAGGGVTLRVARAINDVGQIVGEASNGRGFLLTLDTTVWEGGSFSSGTGWSYGIAPNKNTRVFIDPAASVTLSGPTTSLDLKQLTVGGDSTGNNGIATLSLKGGTLNVLGSAGQFTTINVRGVLTGDGILHGAVSNLGTVDAVNLTLTGGLTNAGTVTGQGRLNANLDNASSGTLQLGAGQSLLLSGAGSHTNHGLVDLSGGARLQVSGTFLNNAGGQVSVADATARFDSAVTNAAGGRFQLNAATLRFNGGLANNGQVQVSFGGAEIFGAVVTNHGGQFILSGNSDTTFYDSVDVQSGGELRVTAGSTAVFFGQVFQRSDALFTGTGTKFYEGGFFVGNSPGLGLDSGNVGFGAGNQYLAEIGGLSAGTLFDAYRVAGTLDFGGALTIVSYNGFVAQAGQRFDLFDWGSSSGQFDAVDTSGFTLADGTWLDTSRLYIDGSVSVQAVPEPAAWALMLLGLGGVGTAARRREKPRC